MRDNIVRVAIYPNRDVVTAAPIYQPDYGLKLLITNVELPTAYSVYFANSPNQGSAKRAIGNENGVEIPTEFISTGKTVYAWLFLHTGSDDGEVVYRIIIPMVGTPEFTDELPTPEQQNAIDQAITALNAAVTQTAADVENATLAKSAAEYAAEQTSESASSAALSEDAAADSARAASESAYSAAQSMEDARESEFNADAFADRAEDAAERAEQAAATAGYLDVTIENGRLIYVRTDAVDVDFNLVDGHLMMEAV